MRPFEFRPFAREDFPDQPWIEKLLRQLNSALGQIRSGLGNGLTLGENLNAEIKDVDVTTREEWVALSLLNGWSALGGVAAPAYRWRDGRIELRGAAEAGTLDQPIATLAAYAPAAYRIFASVCDATAGNTLAARVDVSTAGSVGMTNAPAGTMWVSLDGIAWETSAAGFANPCFPVRFKPERVKGRIAGLVVLRAVRLDERKELPVNSAVSADWTHDATNVSLLGVSGLMPGATYRLRLLLVGG